MPAPDDLAWSEQNGDTASAEVTFHESTSRYRAEFDRHDRSPTVAIVDAVSEATDAHVTELTPLGSVLDAEALEGLFTRQSPGQEPPDLSLSFTYEGCEVTVKARGTVLVRPAATSD